jgi:putative Mg2+ transporter-C (MgtC) family protein
MNYNIYIDYAIRIGVSFVCGFCLGIERKSRQHSVGIRTLVLISISSCLLSILSIYMAEAFNVTGDPTRIAAGVASGIGFIGGGAIMRYGLNIRGLTTAAIIFTASAVGLACGAALYIPALLTMLALAIVLFIMNRLEKRIFPAAKSKLVTITINGTDIPKSFLTDTMQRYGFIIHDMNVEYDKPANQTKLVFTSKAPDRLNLLEFTKEIESLENLVTFKLDDMIAD